MIVIQWPLRSVVSFFLCLFLLFLLLAVAGVFLVVLDVIMW